jgi:hypothetical protein
MVRDEMEGGEGVTTDKRVNGFVMYPHQLREITNLFPQIKYAGECLHGGYILGPDQPLSLSSWAHSALFLSGKICNKENIYIYIILFYLFDFNEPCENSGKAIQSKMKL